MNADHMCLDLSKVGEPIETAVGLPNCTYTDPAMLKFERRKVLGSGWLGVALATDVPNPGDVFPVNVAGQPLIVLRDREGGIRVFHNVCRHRGTQLVDAPSQGRRNLVCPYHAWCYDLTGRLVATPRFNGIEDHSHPTLKDGSQDLKSVRSEVWNHIVFVNLSNDAEPLTEFTRRLDERWAPFDLANVHHGGSMTFEIKANWKLVLENFLESYHLPKVHPELNRYSPLADHVLLVDEVFMGQLSLNYRPKDGAAGLPLFPNLPEDRATTGEYLLLFPNLMLSVTPDHFRITFVTPVTPELTLQRWEFFFVGRESTEERFAEARQTVVDRVGAVTREDIDVLEWMQAGRHSDGFDGGRFSPYHETTTHHFQKLVAQRMNGVS